jgi:hypothetical protein
MTGRIGTLGEKSLHAALKAWYARPGDRLEWSVEGKYVVDIFRPLTGATSGQCIEIQTRSLGKLKTKLSFLLEHWPVRVVYPIAQERHIVRIDADGEIVSRRKSPKRETILHLFPELVGLRPLLTHPNFVLDALLICEEQVWLGDGRGSWRRKHWSIDDRRLLDICETVSLSTPDDYAALLPGRLPDVFDTQELAHAGRLSRSLAQKMAYCLREMAVLEVVGHRGRANLTPEEQQQLETLQWFHENKFSFNTLMSQQHQTLAFALLDSPVGLLAWNAQLLGGTSMTISP